MKYLIPRYGRIYFFGDKTFPVRKAPPGFSGFAANTRQPMYPVKGGNDHEIFEDSRTIGFTVRYDLIDRLID